MGLSRLSNFLKSVRGNIIYVDPNSLDSTDSTENQGNSLTRPFKTIQRALIEAARFSYQRGFNNDRFLKTTILLYPGEHLIDNRPGWIPSGRNNFKLRNGLTIDGTILEWDFTTNFDIFDSSNDLYKVNSVHGGVILPRGTSIVGLDLRKTKIRPLYVPNPENNEIERSAIFRVTGGSYLWQFTILDADPNGFCFKDYTSNQFVPNFSHHKLTAFEYADGVNPTNIKDDFLEYYTDRTDLEMYYQKIGLVYGPAEGREIAPDYPDPNVDIQPVVDEYRVVGSKGLEVGITSIRSGDGTVGTTLITAYLEEEVPELSVDTPIEVSNVNAIGYNGQYTVYEVLDNRTIKYQVQFVPENLNPSATGATLNISVDTVSSASPYIFNVSLRSVFGMCGLHADGNAATGFKSMVVAQFTGIGLQKDDNAFVKYDKNSGQYQDNTIVENLHKDSLARFKPEYENYHVKSSNNGFLQLVSVFAIGYAEHFLAESGGDHSITNSNSNFGAKSLIAKGFRDSSFLRDDCGYITHIVTPKEIEKKEISLSYLPIDVVKTTTKQVSGLPNRLYLYGENDLNSPPPYKIDGYRIGASEESKIYVQINEAGITSSYSSSIVMRPTDVSVNKVSGEKRYRVGRSVAGINSISDNVINLETNHSLSEQESIRIISDNGDLPDGLDPNRIYYVIYKSGVDASDQIRIAKTADDAIASREVVINDTGGSLTIVSRVSDKKSGDIGHPIQWDNDSIAQGGQQWYLTINPEPQVNQIFFKLKQLTTPTNLLGEATARTYFKRFSDTRVKEDKIYKLRYVLPKENPFVARPPLDGYIIQESSDTTGIDNTEISKYFSPINVELSNLTELRNFSFIADSYWDVNQNIANIITELPHNLTIGSQVEILNISSTNNPDATANVGYNGLHTIVGISSSKHFSYQLSSNPGTFSNDTTNRTINLPRYVRKKYPTTYQVYRSKEIQKYEKDKQDGIYYLTVINVSNSPSVFPFNNLKFSQPIQNLYPQVNRDDPKSDPDEARSYAVSDPIGQVIINNPQNSITKETLNKFIYDTNVGSGITNLYSDSIGIAHTFYTSIDHGLNAISSLNIVNIGGDNYEDGVYYNAKLVGFAGSITGNHATASVTVEGGSIISVRIMDGGSAYGIGNTLGIVGIPTAAGNVPAIFAVNGIINNVGDVIKVTGISSHKDVSQYNTLYRITNISNGNTKQFNAVSVNSISQPALSGLGSITSSTGRYIPIGKSIQSTNFTYDIVSGISTINLLTSHPFKIGSKIKISGADEQFFNKDVLVTKTSGLNQISVSVGSTTTTPVTTGTIFVNPTGAISSGGDLNNDTERLSPRISYQYAGITTTVSQTIFTVDDQITINDAEKSGLKIGDYLLIDEEIFRVKQNITFGTFSVFRGILGTVRQQHLPGALVSKIKISPIEFRRHSIIRASGHTFEYLGFGPGNYSTALPERQDRILSPQEVAISQATKIDGGAIIYTGMNSDGDFYNGTRKLTNTGDDQIFDAPIPTVTGEEPSELTFSGAYGLVSNSESLISRSIRVEGGTDSNLISEFNGPVIFSNKITSNSENGVEANSIYLKGDLDVPRKIGIANTTPTLAGNIGDIVTNSDPNTSENVGWVFTKRNRWEKWGWANDRLFGVGISSAGVQLGLSTGVNFVAIGITIGTEYDTRSGITTLRFTGASQLGNTVQVAADDDNFQSTAQIKFIGSQDGFGFAISKVYDPLLQITTLTFEAPLDAINFGTGNVVEGGTVGFGVPTFTTRSQGTRIIYYNTLGPSDVDYATGVDNLNNLWNSIPRNTNAYNFRWYGGINNIATLSGIGSFSTSGAITAGGVVVGTQLVSNASASTAPISLGSTIRVSNLTSTYLANGTGAGAYGLVAAATSTPNTIPIRDTNFRIEGVINRLLNTAGVGETGGYYEDIAGRLGYKPFNSQAGDQVAGISTFFQISDVYALPTTSTVGTDISLNCNFTAGPIAYTNEEVINRVTLSNLPTGGSRSYNYTVIMNTQGSTTVPTSLYINGTLVPIRWLNGSSPTNGLAGIYFLGFTIFNLLPTGTIASPSQFTVLGVFAKYI